MSLLFISISFPGRVPYETRSTIRLHLNTQCKLSHQGQIVPYKTPFSLGKKRRKKDDS